MIEETDGGGTAAPAPTGPIPGSELPPKNAKTPRDLESEALSERFEAQRAADLREAISGDPGLAETQRLFDANQVSEEDPGGPPETPGSPDADGAASREPMHKADEAAAPVPKVDADSSQDDIVETDQGPAFKLLVDGEWQLLPIAKAKAELQKGESANKRLQDAELLRQSNAQFRQELDRRDAQLREAEAAHRASASLPHVAPSEVQSDAPTIDLKAASRDFIDLTLEGNEEGAAEKLFETLSGIQDANGRNGVDPAEIERRAASAAQAEIAQDRLAREWDQAKADFDREYPEIISDPELFSYADTLTDVVKKEHPEFTTSQLMQEAGSRVRQFVSRLRGEPAEETKEPVILDRQARKQQLVPMPSQRTARSGPDTGPDPNRVESPADIIREMRAARNQ